MNHCPPAVKSAGQSGMPYFVASVAHPATPQAPRRQPSNNVNVRFLPDAGGGGAGGAGAGASAVKLLRPSSRLCQNPAVRFAMASLPLSIQCSVLKMVSVPMIVAKLTMREPARDAASFVALCPRPTLEPVGCKY